MKAVGMGRFLELLTPQSWNSPKLRPKLIWLSCCCYKIPRGEPIIVIHRSQRAKGNGLSREPHGANLFFHDKQQFFVRRSLALSPEQQHLLSSSWLQVRELLDLPWTILVQVRAHHLVPWMGPLIPSLSKVVRHCSRVVEGTDRPPLICFILSGNLHRELYPR